VAAKANQYSNGERLEVVEIVGLVCHTGRKKTVLCDITVGVISSAASVAVIGVGSVARTAGQCASYRDGTDPFEIRSSIHIHIMRI